MQYKRQRSVRIEINIKLKLSSLMNKKKPKKEWHWVAKGPSGAAGLYSKLMKVMLHGRIQ